MSDTNVKTHARLSPSGAKRWMVCPGSVKLIEDLNIIESPSVYAAEGTVAHEVHEQCLLKELNASHFLGKTIKADGMSFKVNDDMVKAVQLSLDYIRDRIYSYEIEGYDVVLIVEQRVSLEHLGVDGMDGGTSDVILMIYELGQLVEIEVVDYKHGAGVAVEPEDNPQAMCYALGALAIPSVKDPQLVQKITVTISQPRAIHHRGPIRSWETTYTHLIDWQDNELVPAAKETHKPNARIQASGEGCKFCPAAGQCSAMYGVTQETAMLDFDEFTDQSDLPDVRTMTSEQKMFVMQNADMIRSFLVAVENQVKIEVDHGSTDYEHGYKLVERTTQRKLTEDATDEDFSPLLDYLQPEDLWERKVCSISSIEEKLKKVLKERKVKRLGPAIKEIMEQVTTKAQGELVIAPISDTRPAILPTIISDFTNLD